MFHINNTNPKTQEWAKQVYGMHEFIDTTQAGYNYDQEKGSGGMSANEARVREDKWMASQFSEDLPTLLASGELHGLYAIGGEWEVSALPAEYLFHGPVSNPWRIPEQAPLEDRDRSNFLPVNLGSMPDHLAWDDADCERLGLPKLKDLVKGPETETRPETLLGLLTTKAAETNPMKSRWKKKLKQGEKKKVAQEETQQRLPGWLVDPIQAGNGLS